MRLKLVSLKTEILNNQIFGDDEDDRRRMKIS